MSDELRYCTCGNPSCIYASNHNSDAKDAEIEKLKVENARLVLGNDDLAKANDNCQTKIVALERHANALADLLENALYWKPQDMPESAFEEHKQALAAFRKFQGDK